MTSDSEWFRNVEGCGPPGMWRGVVHTAEVRKEPYLGIVMAAGMAQAEVG